MLQAEKKTPPYNGHENNVVYRADDQRFQRTRMPSMVTIVLSVNVLGYWKLKGEQNVLDGQISQRFLLILQNKTL